MSSKNRRPHRAGIAFSCLLLALGTGSTGHAESLDLSEMAAALALPIVTGGFPGNAIKGTSGDVIFESAPAVPSGDPVSSGTITLVTVTNAASKPLILKLDAISGDPKQTGAGAPFDDDVWQSVSFDCPVTARETVAFLFVGGGGRASEVFAECAGLPLARRTDVGNGILFVGIADAASGAVISEDLIFGSAVVIDLANGGATSLSALPFQAGAGSNDGDKTYSFDGFEYAEFPSGLAGSFMAPTPTIASELILFTLDGTPGQQPAPRVRVSGVAYNDDGVPFDFQYEFGCFDIVELRDIDPNFVGGMPGLGSFFGHLELRSQPIGRAGFDAHDAQFGDGNNIRTPPVAGWSLQMVTPSPDFDNENLLWANALFPRSPPVAVGEGGGRLSWGRPLAMSRAPARPFLSDRPPVFNARF